MSTPTGALIVGVGPGLSASFARLLASRGHKVALAARDTGKLQALASETGASLHACDAADPAQVAALFDTVGSPGIVLYNASQRAGGPLVDLDPAAVHRSLDVTVFGAFLVAQQAARRMLQVGSGCIMLTGASAGVKGFPQSAAFAMGKFALRGLAQSMSRELHPKGIHVLHIVVDGSIRSAHRPDRPEASPDSHLDPDAIAQTMAAMLDQPRSCWTDEIAVRPWVERF